VRASARIIVGTFEGTDQAVLTLPTGGHGGLCGRLRRVCASHRGRSHGPAGRAVLHGPAPQVCSTPLTSRAQGAGANTAGTQPADLFGGAAKPARPLAAEGHKAGRTYSARDSLYLGIAINDTGRARGGPPNPTGPVEARRNKRALRLDVRPGPLYAEPIGRAVHRRPIATPAERTLRLAGHGPRVRHNPVARRRSTRTGSATPSTGRRAPRPASSSTTATTMTIILPARRTARSWHRPSTSSRTAPVTFLFLRAYQLLSITHGGLCGRLYEMRD
jgi:hypothetical protein